MKQVLTREEVEALLKDWREGDRNLDNAPVPAGSGGGPACRSLPGPPALEGRWRSWPLRRQNGRAQ